MEHVTVKKLPEKRLGLTYGRGTMKHCAIHNAVRFTIGFTASLEKDTTGTTAERNGVRSYCWYAVLLSVEIPIGTYSLYRYRKVDNRRN